MPKWHSIAEHSSVKLIVIFRGKCDFLDVGASHLWLYLLTQLLFIFSPVLHEFWTILSRFTKQEEKKKGKWKPRVPSHPTGQMKALAGCKEDRIGALKPPWYYCWSFAENSDLRVLIETLQILIALCKLATINNMHNMAHSYLVLFIFKNSACIFSVTFLLTFYTP